MIDEHQIAVVVAAGGIGSRFAMGGRIKHKQCLFLKDRPLYMWSVLTFLANTRISRIVVVSHQDVIDEIREDIRNYIRAPYIVLNRSRDVKRVVSSIEVVPGGKTRQESVFLGLKHMKSEGPTPDFVLVHDAARPFVRQTMINSTIDTVIKYGACTVALPVSDTIKRVDGENITETIDRSKLVAVHTPQAARFDWLLDAHQEAEKNGVAATDDAYILENANRTVKIVESDRYNIKVTVPEDMLICEAISHMFVSQIMDA